MSLNPLDDYKKIARTLLDEAAIQGISTEKLLEDLLDSIDYHSEAYDDILEEAAFNLNIPVVYPDEELNQIDPDESNQILGRITRAVSEAIDDEDDNDVEEIVLPKIQELVAGNVELEKQYLSNENYCEFIYEMIEDGFGDDLEHWKYTGKDHQWYENYEGPSLLLDDDISSEVMEDLESLGLKIGAVVESNGIRIFPA